VLAAASPRCTATRARKAPLTAALQAHQRRGLPEGRGGVRDGLQKLHHVTVTGSLRDLLMKSAVVRKHLVGRFDHLGFDRHHVRQAADLSVGGKAGGHCGHRAFNHFTGAVELVNSRFIQSRHHQTAPGVGCQQAFAFKTPQSFAGRCSTDFEPVGDHVLRQAVTRLHLVGGDGLQHGLVSHVPQQNIRYRFFFHKIIVA